MLHVVVSPWSAVLGLYRKVGAAMTAEALSKLTDADLAKMAEQFSEWLKLAQAEQLARANRR